MPEIGAVIFCEDIRKENNNKDILLGVFGGDIILPKIPAWVAISLWIEVISSQAEQAEFKFRLKWGASESLEIMAHSKIDRAGSASIPIKGFQLQIEGETEITLEVLEGENWRFLKKKKVYLAPTPTS